MVKRKKTYIENEGVLFCFVLFLWGEGVGYSWTEPFQSKFGNKEHDRALRENYFSNLDER